MEQLFHDALAHLPCASLTKLGCTQVISHVVIGLRTVKGTKQLKLDPTIYDALQKERVHPGDVIYIEANSGARRLWRHRATYCHAVAACSLHISSARQLVAHPISNERISQINTHHAPKAVLAQAGSVIIVQLACWWRSATVPSCRVSQAGGSLRLVRDRVRSGGGGVRADAQGRRAQEEGDRAGVPSYRVTCTTAAGRLACNCALRHCVHIPAMLIESGTGTVFVRQPAHVSLLVDVTTGRSTTA